MKSGFLRVLPVRYEESFVSLLDGRSRLAREVRDRLQRLVADLGGESGLSHAQRSLCKRAIWLEIVIENEESRIGSGGGVDIAPHTQLVGSLLAIFKALGIKRVAREAKLADYLKRGTQ